MLTLPYAIHMTSRPLCLPPHLVQLNLLSLSLFSWDRSSNPESEISDTTIDQQQDSSIPPTTSPYEDESTSFYLQIQ
jgi:hypothetical protein